MSTFISYDAFVTPEGDTIVNLPGYGLVEIDNGNFVKFVRRLPENAKKIVSVLVKMNTLPEQPPNIKVDGKISLEMQDIFPQLIGGTILAVQEPKSNQGNVNSKIFFETTTHTFEVQATYEGWSQIINVSKKEAI